jgi:histidinol phosphatase-like PHP family hydrolase
MSDTITEAPTATSDLGRYETVVAELRLKLEQMEDQLRENGASDRESPGIYDFHTHTFLSDGVLSPIELIRRAIVNGYAALGIADHCGAGTMARVIEETTSEAELALRHWNFRVFPGVELTHVPAASIAELAAEAKRLGAAHVVVHGESPVEPVEPGTNLAAVSCPDVDILAHPGLLTAEEARIAAETGVFVEITAKDGHSLGNGRVCALARDAGADCLLNSDAHLPSHLLTAEFARTVASGAGVSEEELGLILRVNPECLIGRIEGRRCEA